MSPRRYPRREGIVRTALAIAAVAMSAAGCTPASADSPQVLEVREAAADSSGVDGEVVTVDCWDLDEHVIDPQEAPDVFRVICRVHYDQQGTPRWRDMTCIGDMGARPVLEYCYPWLPYDGEPTYEDGV